MKVAFAECVGAGSRCSAFYQKKARSALVHFSVVQNPHHLRLSETHITHGSWFAHCCCLLGQCPLLQNFCWTFNDKLWTSNHHQVLINLHCLVWSNRESRCLSEICVSWRETLRILCQWYEKCVVYSIHLGISAQNKIDGVHDLSSDQTKIVKQKSVHKKSGNVQ